MRLTDLVHPSYIDLNLAAADKEAAIASLARRLEADGAVSSVSGYVEAVLAREALYSTAVGHGVAIPHGKTDAVSRPAVAVGRLRQALPWAGTGAGEGAGDDDGRTVGAGDGDELVHTVFLLAVPEAQTGDTHLRILARLARLLLDEGFRAGLESARTPAEVLETLKRADITEDEASREEETS